MNTQTTFRRGIIPSDEYFSSGPYGFDYREAYAIAWLYKNPCLKMRFVAPNGDSMSEQLFKQLCDYQLARELCSYRFALTEAGEAMYHFKVLDAKQREAHHDRSRAFYDSIENLPDDERDRVNPYRLGQNARKSRQNIFTNPFVEDSYERDTWNQYWLSMDRHLTRDGKWEGSDIYYGDGNF